MRVDACLGQGDGAGVVQRAQNGGGFFDDHKAIAGLDRGDHFGNRRGGDGVGVELHHVRGFGVAGDGVQALPGAAARDIRVGEFIGAAQLNVRHVGAEDAPVGVVNRRVAHHHDTLRIGKMGERLDRHQVGHHVALLHHREQDERQLALAHRRSAQDFRGGAAMLPTEIVALETLDHGMDEGHRCYSLNGEIRFCLCRAATGSDEAADVARQVGGLALHAVTAQHMRARGAAMLFAQRRRVNIVEYGRGERIKII